jgi:predicted trehalose synthase
MLTLTMGAMEATEGKGEAHANDGELAGESYHMGERLWEVHCGFAPALTAYQFGCG